MKRQWTDGEKTLAQQPLSAPKADVKELLRGAFARWHVEKWFERAKQEAGFGAFEVRTYTSLLRHWLSSVRAMFFLASATQRLRGEKSADYVGAGCGRGEYVGAGDLADLAAFASCSVS